MQIKIEENGYQREYKDRLFKAIFGRNTEQSKRWRLDLYNALNNSNYTNPEELELNTIENVIYITMHNDVSFLVDSQMTLYEQQSTYNPNMPLRGLFYFSQLYQQYLTKENKSILRSTLIKIPAPQFIVFYNGKTKKPERFKLRLSEAFSGQIEEGDFEWSATVYNIGAEYNTGLQKKCKALYDYIRYTQRITDNLNKGMAREEAVQESVDWAEENWLLEGFFKEQKAEVIGMILTEFDEENTYRGWREDGIEEGIVIGRHEQAIEAAKNLFKMNVLTHDQIAQATSLSLEEVEQLAKEIAMQDAIHN